MSASVESNLSYAEMQWLQALQVISDETRYKIFKILLSSDEPCVSSIANQLGVSVSAISQHFRLFEHAGLVSRKRYGQKICYRLRDDSELVERLVLANGVV